jgi:hypothetical protein
VEIVGVIAFAFGQQANETAGPSNEEIAKVAIAIVHDEQSVENEVYLSTQWEVEVYCDERSESADFVVSTFGDSETHYINTKDVLDASLKHFGSRNVTRVVLVGHPLHLFFIRLLIATKRWDTGDVKLDWKYRRRMSNIPYDTSPGNQQAWTRGPIVFIAYLFRALLTKKHGN